MLLNAFNLQQWIDQNRHLLKPPVGNKCIIDGDFIVMVVGGPNARTDYHYEAGPEWFYQLEGEMLLKLQIDGQVKDVPIKAGEMFEATFILSIPKKELHKDKNDITIQILEGNKVIEEAKTSFMAPEEEDEHNDEDSHKDKKDENKNQEEKHN